jgi:hypothetical protein
MTDLLSRPSASGTSRRSPGGPGARLVALLRGRPSGGPGSSAEPEGRALTVSAALAALGAVGTAMVTCMGLAVIGWFLADAGAHGQTTDALRVGADAWLVGHGAQLTLSGAPLGIVPLTVAGLISVVVYRSGRWAADTSQPVDDDRTVAMAATIFTGIYVVIAVVTCILVTQDAASPSLGRAIIGSLLVSGVAGTLGMAAGAGRLRVWVDLVPGWIRSVAYRAGGRGSPDRPQRGRHAHVRAAPRPR